jgi:hypothetical protein
MHNTVALLNIEALRSDFCGGNTGKSQSSLGYFRNKLYTQVVQCLARLRYNFVVQPLPISLKRAANEAEVVMSGHAPLVESHWDPIDVRLVCRVRVC